MQLKKNEERKKGIVEIMNIKCLKAINKFFHNFMVLWIKILINVETHFTQLTEGIAEIVASSRAVCAEN